MKTVVIIPTYNEAENIKNIIMETFQVNNSLHILIVDDNSPDKTSEKVKQLQSSYTNNLHLITRDGKYGLGSAYITGFKWALKNKFTLICEMDADGSHNPQHINEFIKYINQGYDVVIGSRRIKDGHIIGWNIFRHIASFSAMKFAKIFLNLKTEDITSGFRCYHKKIFDKINLDNIKSNGYAFQEEMLYLCEKNNFKIKEIAITFVDRKKGKSKLTLKDILEFFIVMIKLKINEYRKI